MYEEISKALHNTTKAHFSVEINAKVGKHMDIESCLETHGFEARNHRGQMLDNLFEREELFFRNTFF